MQGLGFVVEGVNDAVKLERLFPDCLTVVTDGTRYTRKTRMDIDLLVEKTVRVLLITDPDSFGDWIAEKILQDYDFLKVNLDPNKCKCVRNFKQKIGVEHADDDYLLEMITLALNSQ